VGANFIPSTAINQLEMWQADTFDPQTIDRELGWAASIGMNAMRVFLHDLAWDQDPSGLKDRMRQYLAIAWSHRIRTMFVLFDDCWNPDPKPGTQPEPKPGVHNSGWVRSPGNGKRNAPGFPAGLETYVRDIISSFRSDDRILLWDLYNEPGNSGYEAASLPLLERSFQWAREERPTQPLTAGIWKESLSDLSAFQAANSDVISFHNYADSEDLFKNIRRMSSLDRPILCTEYVARGAKSLFQTCLPVLRENQVGAFNWGLVSGKSQTIWPWGSPEQSGKDWKSLEPPLWHHDVFRRDGSPFDPEETSIISSLTGRNRKRPHP
jgi:hypothetical protein